MKGFRIALLTFGFLFALSSCEKDEPTITVSCNDGIKNQDETGIDCGGTCPDCPSCFDGIMNQQETGIDCGGECDPCPTCDDGIQNQDETGVDCGGICDQCPTIQIIWERTIGGSSDDLGYNIINTTDGGYAVVGFSKSNDGDISSNNGTQDMWVVKLSSSGGIEWEKAFGGSAKDEGHTIIQTNDQGYAIVGYAYSDDGDLDGNYGDGDVWIVKLSSIGNVQWKSRIGGSSLDWGRSIIQTDDDGYTLVGWSYSMDKDVSDNHGDSDVWMVRLNSLGVIQWEKTLGGSNLDLGNSMIQTTDGGYAITGWSWSGDGDLSVNNGSADVWVVKTDSNGGIEWEKSFGGGSFDIGLSIIQTDDNGFAIAGGAESNNGDVNDNHGDSDVWIIKLNTNGDIEWKKTMGGSDFDRGHSLIQTDDEGYAILGRTKSNDGDVSENNGLVDIWFIKLNSSGEIELEKTLGGSGEDWGNSIIQTGDGKFTILGWTESNNGDVSRNQGSADFWIVRLAIQ